LAEAGFTKNDVREALKSLGDPRWNRPSSACLATRFPYHSALSPANLAQVRQAEAILADLGFPGVRARHHGDILRIEPPLDQLDRLAAADVRDRLVSAFRALGFRHITLDLAGYTSGVFDPAPAGMPVAAA
jgi:uncharacterized protein